jgi:hypothetical protein
MPLFYPAGAAYISSQLYVDSVVVQPSLCETKYYSFECPVCSLIFCVGHLFYCPEIARLLAEWKEVAFFSSMAYEFSEGSPPSGPFFSASSSRKSRVI